MIISERLLFKGLKDETPLSDPDRLFHSGHALAVSMAVGFSILLLFGLTAIAA